MQMMHAELYFLWITIGHDYSKINVFNRRTLDDQDLVKFRTLE